MKMKHQENAWALKEEALKSKLSANEEVMKIKEDAWKTTQEAWISKVGFQIDIKHTVCRIRFVSSCIRYHFIIHLRSKLGN